VRSKAIDRWGFPVRTVRLTPAKPEPKRQRGFGSFTGEKIDRGLDQLMAQAVPGHAMYCSEIARACDVHEETIRHIQHAAIKKIRARLGPAYMKQLAELLGSHDASLRHLSAA
jgi:hypothetical protein